ncbi:MAG TPA: MarC family protein [Bacteroidia bacterium]|nr:MarC family protein [Bacteroidia bacterium]
MNLNFDPKEILSITLILFAVIDIVGSLPVLLDLQSRMGGIDSRKATVVSGAIMIVFLFLGQSILAVIGIDVSSFAIAGSFIIFVLAVEMILGVKFYKEDSVATASVVPIAFPLIAGTGTLTTLLSIRAEYPHTENIIVAILINLIFVYLVLRNTYRLEKLLGPGGINILRKVFGIILLAIAVKLFRTHAGV